MKLQDIFEVDQVEQGMQHMKRAVGAGGSVKQAERGLEMGAAGEKAGAMQAKALQPYMAALKAILANPRLAMQFKNLAAKAGTRV